MTEFKFHPDMRILDVGGGHNAFAMATDVVDWRIEERKEGKRYFELDVCSDHFPFSEGAFDFVYCRHTLEDLFNPVFTLREMARVGKAGYIETPHVLTELKYGVQNPAWRGWAHHNWLVWSVNNTLKLLPKSHAFQALLVDEAQLESVNIRLFPNGDYKMVNHYFTWDGPFNIQRFIDRKDFQFEVDYDRMIRLAIEESVNYHTRIYFEEEHSPSECALR